MIRSKINLRGIPVWGLLLCIIAVLGCKEKGPASQKKRPNVVFILADDLGLHDLSVTGSDYYETPHIDRIANEGTMFTQGYAASRVCSPSRASIMLGQFTARHGITDWIGAASGTDWRNHGRNDKLLPAGYVHQLPSRDTTLAETMRANGYRTFFAGKWHLGKEGSWPGDHGFDINKGGWDVGSPIGGYFSPWENPNLNNRKKGENLSMRLARETVDFIEKNKDSTFFAYLSFYAVHGPIQTTEKKWGHYRDKAEEMGIKDHGFEMERVLPIRVVQDNPIYAGLVEQMDDAVGLVLDGLKEQGLDENTIVIFTSDNGGVASGDAFSTTNLPLRGGKGYQWEGGIREPYFIKVPGLKNGASIDYPVTGADLYPTVLDLTDIPLKPEQHVDGVSLKPLFEGEGLENRALFWHYPHYGNQGGNPSSIIREGKWKLIHYYEGDKRELYNLEVDPKEEKDISDANPAVTERLGDKLQAFLQENNARFPRKETKYDPELAKRLHREKIEILMPRLEAERLKFLSEDFQPNDTWWDSKTTSD
ncbi:sulfatase [Pricia sp. S334]|uniref:Sulfatase n=1 Tax=Pricia mediterranea TaxID=3076079 RepID=A0ABU3L4W1_9FLAO|nr:sulfatase [Pricia sp. S334]MDT7828293.1 sulfatase [Pricia sp. S334]